MAFIYKRLAEIQYVASSAGSIYTHDTAVYSKSHPTLIILHNGNTTAETVKLYNVPDNGGAVGTAGVANIFYNKSILAGETVFIEAPNPGLVMEDDNDSIQAVTDTGSKVTAQMFGGAEEA